MDEENELMVNEEVLEQTNETENVDTQTTEENVDNVDEKVAKQDETKTEEKKTLAEILKENPEYQEEYNSAMKNRLRRQKNSLEREYKEKYSKLENVLNAGLETANINEATEKLEKFYEGKGVKIPAQEYSQSDLELIAKAEADSITDYDELVDEVDRLAEKGIDRMSAREKLVFKNLAERRKQEENKRELASIGAKKDILDSEDFKEYSSMFKEDVPISKIYERYLKTLPKPEAEPIGDIQTNVSKEEKSEYTPEEVDKLTEEDFNNPIVMKNVRKSMLKWKKQS